MYMCVREREGERGKREREIKEIENVSIYNEHIDKDK